MLEKPYKAIMSGGGGDKICIYAGSYNTLKLKNQKNFK